MRCCAPRSRRSATARWSTSSSSSSCCADRDLRPDARPRALSPHGLRHADASERWGWRFEGHHLSLNFTLAGDKMAVDTPSFFGANPATVPSGAKKGLRALGEEHDAGWALLESLSEAQRARRCSSAHLRRHRHRQQGQGRAARAGRHSRGEARREAARAAVEAVEIYAAISSPASRRRASRAPAGRRRGDALRLGGLDRARQAALLPRAGAALPDRVRRLAERRQPHPYRWRDFSGDFGRDLLREHYAAARAPAPPLMRFFFLSFFSARRGGGPGANSAGRG